MCVWNFQPLMLINRIRHTKSESELFCIPEILKSNVANRFLSTKSPFESVFSSCEFTKVIMQSKSWCKIFVLKLSGIQNNFDSDIRL